MGFETFDFGIFWVGKFGKYFFVWLDLSRDIFFFFFFLGGGGGGAGGIQNNLEILGSASVSRPRSSASKK